ncbi:glycoside hydrolase [Brachybacterium phenoliresistens]|uniref:Glycoside hydrolase n=1 Tax=Brachybacterium phenoliresistens TaxID=396014 RepID=Z9JPQ0_9MICO|nr:glycoside hydrolase 43 family protein [Brachybacterium phenoliresistens]EWS80380.1 glycoside hydrolase [Brachybacterium phenoliresistens]
MHRRSNPVLDADWPDPDAIRAEGAFWMIASSFHRAPGLPVLRSEDLVTWEHVTNALPALPPQDHYALPRRGSGVWAPSLREHAGTYYIVYPDPDHGILVLSAPHPAGPWSAPWTLLPGRGLIDPCPLWDEDGRAYLVHGWARSRAGVKNRLTLVEVAPDLTAPLGAGEVIIDGDALGMTTLEGPKAYRHDGWTWIYAPAGGVATGHQVVFRAPDVHGPYEHRIVLEQGDSDVNGPHQGALVEDEDGSRWFLHFQDRGVFGRVVHVQPVTMGEDGWPRMGEPIDDVRGRPVALVPVDEDGGEYTEPIRSDDFSATVLHPRWHWQANPQPGWSRLAGDGRLRLAFAPSPRGDLRDHGAVLGQQIPGRPSTWEVELTLPGLGPDQEVGPDAERAGLIVLGRNYAWAGLERSPAGVRLVARTMAADQADEVEVAAVDLSADPRRETSVHLRLDVDAAGRIGITGAGRTLLTQWQAMEGHWIGAEIGLFAAGAGPVREDLSARAASFGPVQVRREGRDA